MSPSRRQFLKTCALLAIGSACAVGAAGCSGAEPAKLTVRDVARKIIDGMDIEEKVAQLFVVTPEQVAGVESVLRVDDALLEGLRCRPVCGMTFFTGNLVDTAQTQELLLGVQDMAFLCEMPPLFLCVDEEGGPVQRIGGRAGFGKPHIESARAIGATGDVEVARESARAIATTLRELGFNVDFAPSCDISSGPGSNMHSRSFGTTPELVTNMVLAQVEAFGDEGILCCAKHFPGIGDPSGDSHDGSIYSNRSLEELQSRIEPFAAAIDAGVPFVMVGHLSLPQITGSAVPASLSPEIVTGVLRDDLGYDGVVITDSLGMGALLEFCGPAEVAVRAVEAGCDIALMPPDFAAAYDGMVEAVESGRISEDRIDQSLERILSLKLAEFPELFDEATVRELALRS